MIDYLKGVALAFVSLLVQLILFFVCFCGNLHQDEETTFVKLGIALACVAAGYLLTRPAVSERGRHAYWVALTGDALLTGGIVAGISPLVASATCLLGMADGFLLCLLAWLVLSLLAAASVGLAVAMVRTALGCVLRLDFYVLFYCIMLFVTGMYAMLHCLSTAIALHPLVGILTFLCVLGGGFLGVKAPAVEEDGVIYDASGNPHYVVGGMGSDRKVCTDGGVWRREADGRFSKLN